MFGISYDTINYETGLQDKFCLKGEKYERFERN